MRRLAFLAVLLVAVCGPSFAADDLPSEVGSATAALYSTAQALVGSPEKRKRAWGAHLAATLPPKQAEAIRPALVRLLDAHGYSKEWDDRAVTAAAFDALIRLDRHVPPAKLLTHIENFPAQVITLLARDTDEARPQLRKALSNGLRGADWMAVVAELVRRHDPSVADALLQGLRLRLKIDVLPARNMMIGVGGSGKARKPSQRVVAAAGGRKGWPPFVDYTLADAPERGDRVLVAGPVPMFLRRVVSPPGTAQCVRVAPEREQHAFRIRMLQDLASPPGPRLRAVSRLTIYWESPEDYVRRVQEAWMTVRISHGSMVETLRRTGLLGAAQAQRQRLRLKIEPTWHGATPMELPDVREPK